MIIVVDSGSSKADWRVIGGEQEGFGISTKGFNPVFHNEEMIRQEVRQAFEGKLPFEQVQQVYFYCAGCWDVRRKSVIANALRELFDKAEIYVEHDLLGAARAACGREAGITCIVGTGSNSCLFDGEYVIDNITNLGYLVGDEGSGTYLGKELIRAYFYREIPSDLLSYFEAFQPGGQSAILDKVYGKDTPNVYLASFVPFFADHRGHVYIQKILYEAFSTFVDRHPRKYKGHMSLPVHFIGSVAYLFQDIMRTVLEERAMQPGIFIQRPIDSLADFHASSSSLVN